MLVAKSALTHIGQLDGTLRAGVHEPIAALRVEFGSRDDFSKLLHVCRLDVYNIEALILDVEIPQIDAQIVTANESLAIAVDGDAIDVISMGIGIGAPRYCSHDSIMVGHSRELQLCGILKARARSSSPANTGWSQLIGEIVLSDDLE